MSYCMTIDFICIWSRLINKVVYVQYIFCFDDYLKVIEIDF